MQAGQIGQLIGGNRNTSDKLLKIISEKKRGKGDKITNIAPGVSGGQVTVNQSVLDGNGNLENNILYYNRTNVVGRPNGEPFKVVVTSATNGTVNGKKKTIVVEGGDVYIDQNVSGSPLGIIVMPDYSITGSRWGGNVYICSSVTETHMNVSAEGSMYTYGDLNGNEPYAPRNPAACFKNGSKDGLIDADSGLPVYTGATQERLIQSNQYSNYGSINSKNSYGGSTMVPAITGYGEKVQSTDPNTLAALKDKARFQDLNFLRWAKVISNPNYDTMKVTDKNAPAKCWDFYEPTDVNGLPCTDRDGASKLCPAKNGGNNFSTSLGTDCATNAPPLTGIVNFFYEDQTSILPLFKDLVNQAK